MSTTQFDVGTYGGRICTPASVLVACQFLLGRPLSPDLLRQCLQVAHVLYVERFTRMQLLMVEDVLPLLPAQSYVQTLVAGAGPDDDYCEMDANQPLLLRALPSLLSQLLSEKKRVAAVLTTRGHTCAYLFDGSEEAQRYDPAVGFCVPLRLDVVPHGEYSGVVLRLLGATCP